MTHKLYVIEDNPGDILLMQEALQDNQNIEFSFVNNGVSGLDHLLQSKNEDLPNLIFLDLNIPKLNGKQVLARLKADARLKKIPVIILTGSSSPHDVLDTYDLHANCFVVKPIDLDKFISMIKSLANFWFDIALIPKKS